jgi:hypothetical protein
VGLFLFGKISNIVRSKAGGFTDMIHSFYELEEDTIDVLFLGSSHGYSAIQPNILWEDQGVTSYVMCSQRQTVATSYYLLKEALNYQQPKVVVLESYYFWYKDKYVKEESDVQLRQAADGMRLGRVKYEMLEDFIGDKYWRDKLTYYIPFIKYHSRWDELRSYDFNSNTYLKGGILDFTVQTVQDLGVPDEAGELPQVTLEYLDRIIELCQEKGIELVLYEAPYSAESDETGYRNRHKVTNALEQYLAERDIPFLYYQKTNAAGIDYEQDFRDYSHLNTKGAAKITHHLGQYLVQEYQLTDHRGDEAYRSWDDDLEQFLAAVEEAGGTLQ